MIDRARLWKIRATVLATATSLKGTIRIDRKSRNRHLCPACETRSLETLDPRRYCLPHKGHREAVLGNAFYLRALTVSTDGPIAFAAWRQREYRWWPTLRVESGRMIASSCSR